MYSKKLYKPLIIFVIGILFALPIEAKTVKIKMGDGVKYEGEAYKRQPKGKGILRVYHSIYTEKADVLTGTFDGQVVTDANLNFENGWSFDGVVEYRVEKGFLMSVVNYDCKEGTLYNDRGEKMGHTDGDWNLTFRRQTYETEGDVFKISVKGSLLNHPEIKPEFLADFCNYAGSQNYTIKEEKYYIDIISGQWNVRKLKGEKSSTEILFDNSTSICISGSVITYKKSSGEYMTFAHNQIKKPREYKLLFGQDWIKNGIVHHVFENGNIYEGTVSLAFLNSGPANNGESPTQWRLEDYHTLKFTESITWLWKDFDIIALNGSLIKPDGKTIQIEGGTSSSPWKIAQVKAEKQRIEATKQEEAKREAKRQEEAKRQAKEKEENQKLWAEWEAKYGKKYTDAVINGEIIAGMPEFLAAVVVKMKDLSISLAQDNGSSKLYYISGQKWVKDIFGDYTYKDVKLCSLWITNGIVTSVSWYNY